MQEIAIEPVGLQPFQRTLAGGDRAAPRGVARQHLGYEIQFVAFAGDRIRDDELGVAIHLGSVDMGHAEVDAALERRDRLFAVAAVEIPGALPDHGDVGAVLAEWFLFQNFLRHCERSEAIHLAALRNGLLRRYAPRNTLLISATSTVPVTDSVM